MSLLCTVSLSSELTPPPALQSSWGSLRQLCLGELREGTGCGERRDGSILHLEQAAPKALSLPLRALSFLGKGQASLGPRVAPSWDGLGHDAWAVEAKMWGWHFRHGW